MKKVKLTSGDFKSLNNVVELLDNSILKNAAFDIVNDEKIGGTAATSEFAKVEPGYAKAVWAQA